jgi:hypothetical protein
MTDPLDPLPDPPHNTQHCILCRADADAAYLLDRFNRIQRRPDVDNDNARAALTITLGISLGCLSRLGSGPLELCEQHAVARLVEKARAAPEGADPSAGPGTSRQR